MTLLASILVLGGALGAGLGAGLAGVVWARAGRAAQRTMAAAQPRSVKVDIGVSARVGEGCRQPRDTELPSRDQRCIMALQPAFVGEQVCRLSARGGWVYPVLYPGLPVKKACWAAAGNGRPVRRALSSTVQK